MQWAGDGTDVDALRLDLAVEFRDHLVVPAGNACEEERPLRDAAPQQTAVGAANRKRNVGNVRAVAAKPARSAINSMVLRAGMSVSFSPRTTERQDRALRCCLNRDAMFR